MGFGIVQPLQDPTAAGPNIIGGIQNAQKIENNDLINQNQDVENQLNRVKLKDALSQSDAMDAYRQSGSLRDLQIANPQAAAQMATANARQQEMTLKRAQFEMQQKAQEAGNMDRLYTGLTQQFGGDESKARMAIAPYYAEAVGRMVQHGVITQEQGQQAIQKGFDPQINRAAAMDSETHLKALDLMEKAKQNKVKNEQEERKIGIQAAAQKTNETAVGANIEHNAHQDAIAEGTLGVAQKNADIKEAEVRAKIEQQAQSGDFKTDVDQKAFRAYAATERPLNDLVNIASTAQGARAIGSVVNQLVMMNPDAKISASVAKDMFANETDRRAFSAITSILGAKLRLDSGAAINAGEWTAEMQKYHIQPGASPNEILDGIESLNQDWRAPLRQSLGPKRVDKNMAELHKSSSPKSDIAGAKAPNGGYTKVLTNASGERRTALYNKDGSFAKWLN